MDRYLREITAPGVDTKFVERHRALLAQILGVPSSPSGFLSALGLRAKPETLRLRPSPSLGLAPGLSDLTARVDELATLSISARSAIVIENEVTFLSVPVPPSGVVIWGKGFDVNRAGSMPWLADADIFYWGDVDTHGFVILNQLRAWLPQTRPLLWIAGHSLGTVTGGWREDSPASSRLDRLSAAEQALYRNLVTDRLGDRIRLEQERRLALGD